MEEAAGAGVDFLVNRLSQLVSDYVKLIKDVDNQADKLNSDLRLFREFLKINSSKKRRNNGLLQQLVREIRDVVYEAETIIDAFVTESAVISTSQSFIPRAIKKHSLHEIATKINVVGVKVREKINDHTARTELAGQLNIREVPRESGRRLARKDKRVVGFEDQATEIKKYLNDENEELDVISVIGMPGLGKTTLAWEIFHDKEIEYEFPTRIWVYVSQDFSKKAVYLAILKEFIQITNDISQKSDDDLSLMVYSRLERGKFLIVMDDVWSRSDWNKIQEALPKRNKDCKILITSRDENVARHANRQRNPHKLRFLNVEDSSLLLQYEVFGIPRFPSNLEHLGRIIAQRCGGLPLALVVIGGILVDNISDNVGATEGAWNRVSNSVGTCLIEEDRERSMETIIALSYDILPEHLQACFLYLGMFPKDSGIPVGRLISMWIAEGFIEHKDDISLEETAQSYLNDLINRNLVRLGKRSHDGGVKTCHIHDVLRDFCKKEAGSDRENFFQEIKTPHTDLKKLHRLCLHSNILDFISSKPKGPQVRSFVCVSQEDIDLPLDKTAAIPSAFQQLRVMDVKPIKFTRISREMYKLIHLRHIVLSFNSNSNSNSCVLPSTFSKFWNLQTLIIETPSRTIEIRADVWKLSQLRNLKTNASTIIPQPGTGGKEGGELQTLGMIAPESCTEKVFDRAQNLRTLGIRGRLSSFLKGKVGSFGSLRNLRNFEKLKLLHEPLEGSSKDRLGSLPPHDHFPLKLKFLTLSKTFLDWSCMSILGSLENLEVLKLKNKAFMGNYWDAKDGGFRKLAVLHIGHTDLVYWKASHDHFPKLRCLELYNCEELQGVPKGLLEVPDFQRLDLHRSTRAASSAKWICDGKPKKWEEQGFKDRQFKLTIFPPS